MLGTIELERQRSFANSTMEVILSASLVPVQDDERRSIATNLFDSYGDDE